MSGWQTVAVVFVTITAVAVALEVSPRFGGVLLFLVVMVMLSRGLRIGTIGRPPVWRL